MKVNNSIFTTLSRVAETNDEYSRARLAAAIIKNNRIISFGINRKKSDPLQAKYCKNKEAIYLHAEIHSIKNALKNFDVDELRGSTMYICRVKRPTQYSKKWVWGLAKPCSGCSRALAEFGIKNVIYTTDKHLEYEIL